MVASICRRISSFLKGVTLGSPGRHPLGIPGVSDPLLPAPPAASCSFSWPSVSSFYIQFTTIYKKINKKGRRKVQNLLRRQGYEEVVGLYVKSRYAAVPSVAQVTATSAATPIQVRRKRGGPSRSNGGLEPRRCSGGVM